MKVTKTDKFKIIILFASLALALLMVVTVIITFIDDGKGEAEEAENPSYISFETGWKTQFGLFVDVTRLSQRSKDLSISTPYYLINTIPDNEDGAVMLFRTNNLVVNVYVDDECISYFGDSGNCRGITSFQQYRIARFRPSDSGKTVWLEIFTTPVSDNCCIDNIFFGDSAALILSRVSGSAYILAFGIVIIIAGLVFITIGIFTRKAMDHSRGMIFFGIFAIFMAIWSLCGSAWVSLVTDNVRAVEVCLWLNLATGILFGLMFIYEVFKIVHTLLYNTLFWLWAAALVSMILLTLTGLIQPGEMINVINILILLAAVIILVELIMFLMHNHGNKEQTNVLYIGMIVFVAFGLLDVMRFYQGNKGDYSYMTRLGMAVLVIIVAIIEIREATKLLNLGIKAGRIGRIAYTDANTGIGNVAAFKEKMDTLEFTKINYNYIGIIQFDVNNLKVVNDTKGHEAGDYLIKSAANVINRSFGTIGTCYRTGGDEFVAITTYNHAPIACQEAIMKFNSLIDQFNNDRSRPFDLRIAYGVAYYESSKNPYASLKDIHKIADERMYNNKKELKARYAKTPEEAQIR